MSGDGGRDLIDRIIGYWISADERQEPICVTIEESKGYSMIYEFYMNEDKTEFECGFLEGEFIKVEDEELL